MFKLQFYAVCTVCKKTIYALAIVIKDLRERWLVESIFLTIQKLEKGSRYI